MVEAEAAPPPNPVAAAADPLDLEAATADSTPDAFILFGDPQDDLDMEAEEDYPSDPEGFTQESLNAKQVVLCLSKSIVSLVSSVDGKPLFACTGTVVNHVGSETWILTSATLVKKPDTDHDAYKADEVKIEVLLHDKRTINGCISMCNLHYNVAVVTVEIQFDLPMVALNDLPECYSLLGQPVIAVARDSKSGALLVRQGNMIRTRSKLDCSELLLCTCPVNKIFIGGLVVDFERKIIGVTFFGKDTTHIVPTEIMARCVKHFKKFRTLKQPRVCIRGHALHSLELSGLEILCIKFPNLSCGIGVVVDQISGISSADFGGIEAGDIICSIDGVVLYSVAQLTAILLDTVFAMKPHDAKILQVNLDKNYINFLSFFLLILLCMGNQAVMQRPRDNTKFVAMLNICENGSVECGNSFYNRWPLL